MDKLQALFQSRRFWAAVAGVVFVAYQSAYPEGSLDKEAINKIVLLIGSWIVGDSLKDTVVKPKGTTITVNPTETRQPPTV